MPLRAFTPHRARSHTLANWRQHENPDIEFGAACHVLKEPAAAHIHRGPATEEQGVCFIDTNTVEAPGEITVLAPLLERFSGELEGWVGPWFIAEEDFLFIGATSGQAHDQAHGVGGWPSVFVAKGNRDDISCL